MFLIDCVWDIATVETLHRRNLHTHYKLICNLSNFIYFEICSHLKCVHLYNVLQIDFETSESTQTVVFQYGNIGFKFVSAQW